MKILFNLVLLISVIAHSALAVERKPFTQVNTNTLIRETQVTPKGADNKHIALAWWVPKEYWENVLSQDKNTSEANKKALLKAISGVSLLAIVQADVSDFGAFKYYSKEYIENDLVLSFSAANGKNQKLTVIKTIAPDLEVVLNILKPILSSAMGNLGKNLHFYVINNTSESKARILDPYKKGQINFQLSRKDGVLMNGHFELPIDALFVPRKCPNGKNAHISWQYCPWSGKKLEK